MSGETPHSPADVYRKKFRDRSEELATSQRIDRRFSTVRAAVFLTGLLMVIAAIVGDLPWLWTVIPAGLFLIIVPIHGRTIRRRDRCLRVVAHYQGCLARIERDWEQIAATIPREVSPHHPYANDLDLFGPRSVWSLLAGYRTPLGADRLTDWLATPSDAAIVRRRQDAVRELTDALDVREQMALLPPWRTNREGGHRPNAPLPLLEWVVAPARPVAPSARVLAVAFSLLTVISGGYYLLTGRAAIVGLIAITVQLIFLNRYRSAITESLREMDRIHPGLKTLRGVLAVVEGRTHSAEALREIDNALTGPGLPPSQHLGKLQRRTETLRNALQNQFFAPLALLVCLPVHLIAGIERWRMETAERLPRWCDALAEYEALLTLGGYRFENPKTVFPEVLSSDNSEAATRQFEATGLGHPLLPDGVRNDADLGIDPQLLLVSGSNMSGKSTYLRSIGVNAVLAMTGGPVHAESLRMGVCQLGTELRVHDSLQSGESLFYAVIRRLKQIVDLADGDLPLLFLLDEILQGTNSHDRRIGAEAVIRGLLERGAFGVVTTHDLALTEIVDSVPASARNVHFRDEIVDGELVFEYRLQPGVVRRSNALQLMRMIGLGITEADAENAAKESPEEPMSDSSMSARPTDP